MTDSQGMEEEQRDVQLPSISLMCPYNQESFAGCFECSQCNDADVVIVINVAASWLWASEVRSFVEFVDSPEFSRIDLEIYGPPSRQRPQAHDTSPP
jgi:hypothetical protein